MTKRICHGCGRELVEHEFEPEYTHCIAYCCGCCPSKHGFKGESCQKDWVDRQKGRPVGVVEGLMSNV